MRRSILLLALVLLLMLAAVPAASARVHAITPLNNLACTGVGDPPNLDPDNIVGARGANDTPAATDGGPLVTGMGPIPNSTSNAGLPIGNTLGAAAPVAACPP